MGRSAATLVLLLVAAFALLCIIRVDARRHHRATPKKASEVDVATYERVLPSQGNRRSPLPHDLMAPNGGAPWQGGNKFEAKPTGQQVRPLPTEPQADGPIAQTQVGLIESEGTDRL